MSNSENANIIPEASPKSSPVAKVLGAIASFFTKINTVVGKVLSYSLVLLVALIFVEVIRRYIFQSPSVWGYDVSLWLYGMPAMLGGGYVLSQKGHVNMDLLYNKFGPRGKAIVDLCTSLMFFAFVGVLVVQGIKFANSSIQGHEMSISSWKVLIWPIKIFIPISAILLLIQGVAEFIKNAYMALTGKELPL